LGRIQRLGTSVSVGDRSAYIAQQAATLDKMVMMIQVLLALTVLVAVLGIINTMALSVLERTRELGLLRAIGLSRGQCGCRNSSKSLAWRADGRAVVPAEPTAAGR
jgi:ABC-type antimicrobial peptide transport system permease subunit